MNTEVISILICPIKGRPMEDRFSAQAIAGVGLEGDRYAVRQGAYSGVRIPDEDRQVTLISKEAIDKVNLQLLAEGIQPFSPEELRRNIILTIGTDELNDLVGQRFFVGEVEMEGAELCEPCRRPAALSSRSSADGKAFEKFFKGRGGLRARIISGGQIKIQDKLLTLNAED